MCILVGVLDVFFMLLQAHSSSLSIPLSSLKLAYRYCGSGIPGSLFSSRFHAKSEIKVFMSPVPSLQGSTG